MIEYSCPSCGNKLKSISIGLYCENCKNYYNTNCIHLKYLITEFSPKRLKQKMSKEGLHKVICAELNELYKDKNADYGDSFHESFKEDGLTMVRIRLGDKFNRFKTLSKGAEQKVDNESIRDTLLDLANYAIMAIMELDTKENNYENKKQEYPKLD